MAEWTEFRNAYVIDAQIERDGDGYMVTALNLPGCASQGDTPEEAEANIVEAATGCLESYLAAGEPIPWRSDYPPRPFGAERRRLTVKLD